MTRTSWFPEIEKTPFGRTSTIVAAILSFSFSLRLTLPSPDKLLRDVAEDSATTGAVSHSKDRNHTASIPVTPLNLGKTWENRIRPFLKETADTHALTSQKMGEVTPLLRVAQVPRITSSPPMLSSFEGAISQPHPSEAKAIESDPRLFTSAHKRSPTTGGTVTSQIAYAVWQKTVTNGQTEIKLRLFPRELGSVQLTLLSVDKHHLNIVIAAQESETSELIRRHLSDLEQELEGIGFDDINFTFHADEDHAQLPQLQGQVSLLSDVQEYPDEKRDSMNDTQLPFTPTFHLDIKI